MLFDTHTHLNAEQYEMDCADVIQRAEEAGVTRMVVVGFDRPTITKAMELIDTYPNLFGVIGWHPVDAVDLTDEDLNWIEELTKHPKVVALGEMGLDYHWDKSPADVQKRVFRKQIHLARKLDLPIVIHNREATNDVLTILEEENAQEVGGIMHCFSGDLEAAKRTLDLGFHISFGGPVTFKNAEETREVAKHVPLNRLLIETDCPYLSPHPYRGKRNEPARVKLVAEQLAELHELSLEELAALTMNNANQLFRI